MFKTLQVALVFAGVASLVCLAFFFEAGGEFRQVLVEHIALTEFSYTPPPNGYIDQLKWLYTHRLSYLRPWLPLVILGVIMGAVEGIYGRMVWGHGGTSPLLLLIAKIIFVLFVMVAAVVFSYPYAHSAPTLVMVILPMSVATTWAVIRGIPSW